MDVEKLLKKCKELGFTVTEADKKYVCISQYSPEGQDCNVCVETENLIENLRTYAECFDVSEETHYWLDSFGHGSNGAPYDMKDVYEDMQWWKDTLFKLVNQLEHIEANKQENRTFRIRYYECYEGIYEIDADSAEVAKEILQERIQSGEEEGPQQCCNSGYEIMEG